jgi:hypothetical protein
MVVLIRAAIQVILLAVGVADAAALSWNFFTTPKAAVQGPAANPTPAQQVAGAAGDIAGGTGQAAAATGGLAKQIGENPALLMIGGAVVLLVALRR